MTYYSIIDNYIHYYLDYNLIIDDIDIVNNLKSIINYEFSQFLIDNNYNNLDLNQFKELFLSSQFKSRLLKNNIYNSYTFNKYYKNKILVIENKLNYLLLIFIFIFICIKTIYFLNTNLINSK